MTADLRRRMPYSFVAVFVLTILGAVIYGQSVAFDFVSFDDYVVLKHNPDLYKWDSWKQVIPWAFTSFTLGDWQPLTWISFILNYRLFGLDPASYHVVNVAIHIGNSILFYFVADALLSRSQKGIAFIMAALFMVHPQHVESVAWISERKDVLSAFFWLVTMLTYLKYVQQKGIRSLLQSAEVSPLKFPAYYLMLLLYLLGIFTKPTLVTLPFVLLLLDFWPLERIRAWKLCIAEKIPMFILVVLSCVMTILAVTDPSNASLESFETYSFFMRFQNAFIACFDYLIKTFFPYPLYFYYPYPESFPIFSTFVAAFVIISVTVLAFVGRKENPHVLVGWLWFLGTLVPVIGFLQVGEQAAADRYMYFPHMGLFLMVVPTVDRWMHQSKLTVKIGISAIIILCFTVLAFIQTRHWRNSETLYKHALQHEPRNFYIQEALCIYLVEEGRHEEAQPHCQEALSINPERGIIYWDLGKLALEDAKFEDALNHFKEYLRIILPKRDPENRNIEQVIEEAVDGLEQVLMRLEKSPDDANLYYHLGNYWAEKKLRLLALDAYQEALKLNPNDIDAHINIANVYFLFGKFRNARRHFHRALNIDSRNYRAHYNYALFLLGSGEEASAQLEFEIMQKIDPGEKKMKNQLKEAIRQAKES